MRCEACGGLWGRGRGRGDPGGGGGSIQDRLRAADLTEAELGGLMERFVAAVEAGTHRADGAARRG